MVRIPFLRPLSLNFVILHPLQERMLESKPFVKLLSYYEVSEEKI